MIKKILLIISTIFIFYFWTYWLFVFASSCSLWSDIGDSVTSCLEWTDVFPVTGDLVAEGWLKDTLINWIKNIWVVLSLFAVSWIVVWSYFMVFSSWEEEKVKKWKDIVKWSMLWFLWIISSSTIIWLIVNLMYSFD